MSLLDLIEEEGSKAARAQQETREALERLHEANLKLSEEVKERRLAEQRLRILCDTMSNYNITLEQRIIRMLQEACENFSLDAGILAQISDGKYIILYSWTRETLDLEMIHPGTVHNLEDTYCRILDHDGTSIGVEEIGQSDWKGHPLYLSTHIEAYLGVCVSIRNDFWGSLCFLDLIPRVKLFNQPDHDFLRLMAQWIGAELSLQRINNEH